MMSSRRKCAITCAAADDNDYDEMDKLYRIVQVHIPLHAAVGLHHKLKYDHGKEIFSTFA